MHLFQKRPLGDYHGGGGCFRACGCLLCGGHLFFRKGPLENQLAGAVMLGNINNVLVIVFSSRFFGPVEPLVAAMYMIPFFVLVIPLRYYRHRRKAKGPRIEDQGDKEQDQ